MNSEYSIRRAMLSDLAVLPEVERSAAVAFHAIPGLAWIADGDVTSEEMHSRYLAEGNLWVAADRNDCPVGFVIVRLFGNEAHIVELSVRREHQRRGLGRALLLLVVDWARRAGLEQLTLTTFRNVPWNAPFYRSMGFREAEAGELDSRLALILQGERERGLPAEARCAMRLRLFPQ